MLASRVVYADPQSNSEFFYDIPISNRKRTRVVVNNEVDCDIVVSKFKPGRSIEFISKLIPVGKVWTDLSY